MSAVFIVRAEVPEADRAAFDHCTQDGLLCPVAHDDQYAFSLYWSRALRRFLRERHLI